MVKIRSSPTALSQLPSRASTNVHIHPPSMAVPSQRDLNITQGRSANVPLLLYSLTANSEDLERKYLDGGRWRGIVEEMHISGRTSCFHDILKVRKGVIKVRLIMRLI